MDSMNLKDFRPNESDLLPDQSSPEEDENQIQGSNYHEEMNTLKIDKLSNKITIISIIIPVMIGALLIFAYLDMKERVFDADQTKQNQVDQISRQLEEKLNALDVKIAKNRFDLENTLPALQEKTIALDGKLVKLNNNKAEKETIQTQFSSLIQNVNANIEKMKNDILVTIKTNQKQLDKTAQQLKEEITLFKEEFDARLLELSDYEQQIGVARKDLSLLDKKYKRLEQDQLSKEHFNTQMDQIEKDMAAQKAAYSQEIIRLENKLANDSAQLKKKIDQLTQSAPSNNKTNPPVINTKPTPQVKIEPSPSTGIKQKPLSQ
ncbi:MAG: hypothetical protein ABIJ59_06895 [Pseudomonadota bacterium]